MIFKGLGHYGNNLVALAYRLQFTSTMGYQLGKLFCVLGLVGLLTACGGGSGGSTTTGITANFNATHYQTAATGERLALSGNSRTFTNSEGVQITLTQAYLTIWSVRLDSECSDISFSAWLEAFGNVLLPTAQAHTDTTPTQLGVPNVLSLLNPDLAEIPLGNVTPPPDQYCGLTVELLKADDDAVGLPEEIDMVNRLLYLEGSYLSPGSNTAVPFILDTGKAAVPRKVLLSAPLSLSADNRTANLTLGIEYDRWFNGIDFNDLQSETQLNLLLNNLTEAIVLFGE